MSVKRDSAGSLYNAPWGQYKVDIQLNDEIITLESEALLNATGRTPNVFGLGLEKVSIHFIFF